MSENIVTLTNKKKNEIEFEMEVEGLTVEPSDIRFIIETADMDYAFKCTKKKGKMCTVTIPPLPQLEKTIYPFRIETVIDGYHFTPMKGKVNVTGSFDVYTTDPKNKTVAPPTKKEEPKKAAKKAAKKEEPKKTDTKISDLAKKVTGKKEEPKKTSVKKKAAPKKVEDKSKKNSEEEVKETASILNIDGIKADKLVKDAIAQIKDVKLNPTPVEKTETKPFFKKVTEKKESKVVTEEAKIVEKPEPSEKDKAVHAILETKEEKPAAPTVAFKKGKRVKN